MLTAAEKRFTVFCAALVVLFHLGLLALKWPEVRAGRPDFAPLYAAGKSALNHVAGPLQSLVLSGASPNAVFESPLGVDRLHPPFEMLIFAPLSLLSYQTAFLVWYSCNLAMLLSVPLLLWRHLPNLHHWFAYIVILGATFFPAFVAVVQGQDSILLLFLLTLCFRFLKSRREFLGGAVLALGIFKFTLVIPMMVGFALLRKWRVLAGFFSGVVAVLSATTILWGSDAIPSYVRFLAGRSGGGPIEALDSVSLMPNLRGFLHYIGAGAVSHSWIDAAAVLASILLLVLVGRNWAASAAQGSSQDLLFSMQILTAVIVSYHLFIHDASVLILPILLILNRLAAADRRMPFGVLCMLAGGIAIIYVFPFVAPMTASMPVLFCAAGLLLAGLYLSLRNDKRTQAELKALSDAELPVSR